MSAFQVLAAATFPALDGAFGERLIIRHRLAGVYVGGVADPDNPEFLAVGILDVEGKALDDSGPRDAARAEVITVQPQVDFACAQFGDGRLAPVKDCVITAIDRDGAPQFRVLAPKPSDDGRVTYLLAAL